MSACSTQRWSIPKPKQSDRVMGDGNKQTKKKATFRSHRSCHLLSPTIWRFRCYSFTLPWPCLGWRTLSPRQPVCIIQAISLLVPEEEREEDSQKQPQLSIRLTCVGAFIVFSVPGDQHFWKSTTFPSHVHTLLLSHPLTLDQFWANQPQYQLPGPLPSEVCVCFRVGGGGRWYLPAAGAENWMMLEPQCGFGFT